MYVGFTLVGPPSIHFYIGLHYIHAVDSQPQIQQSLVAGDSPPSNLMTSPVHRSPPCMWMSRLCHWPSLTVVLLFFVHRFSWSQQAQHFLKLALMYDKKKHGLSLVHNFRLILLYMVSTIRSCDNVISIFSSIPRDLQVARTILHSSLFGQSNIKCSTVSVATPHALAAFVRIHCLYRSNGIYHIDTVTSFALLLCEYLILLETVGSILQ